MGANRWGASPLYVNPVADKVAEVLAQGKGANRHEPPGADPRAEWCGEGRHTPSLTRLGIPPHPTITSAT